VRDQFLFECMVVRTIDLNAKFVQVMRECVAEHSLLFIAQCERDCPFLRRATTVLRTGAPYKRPPVTSVKACHGESPSFESMSYLDEALGIMNRPGPIDASLRRV